MKGINTCISMERKRRRIWIYTYSSSFSIQFFLKKNQILFLSNNTEISNNIKTNIDNT